MRRHILASPCFALASAAFFLAGTATAETTASDRLGGPVIACEGEIAWSPAVDGTVPASQEMRLAVPDAETASEVILFHDAGDLEATKPWRCETGLCTSFSVQASGVTVTVLRILPRTDDASGKAYTLEVVFSVIGATGAQLQPENLVGSGEFDCAKPLPASVVSDPK